jgi:hypothetical protein
MNPNHLDPGDPDLVAFVHGELDADTERAVRARLAADPDLRAQHAALLAADRALAEELETPRAGGGRLHGWWRPVLAAAALVVVGLVIVLPRDDAADASAAHNELVGLRARPLGGAQQPILTDAGLELTWQNRLAAPGSRRLKVLPYHLTDTLAALGRAEAADPENARSIVPMVVAAVLHAPDGARVPARLAAPIAWVHQEAPHLQMERLWSFEVETGTPPPYLGGRPGDRTWVEDFAWAHQHMPHDGPRRWLLDQPGEWTLELRVESVPPPTPGLWPTFAEPLVVATRLIATGIVSDWGPVHDGMRARLLLATGCADLDHAPLALQLQNVGDHTRRYNVIGTTMAKIPQPLHFDLFVGSGEPLQRGQQHDGLGVLIREGDLMVAHPAGTVRTLVTCADYWRFRGIDGSRGKRLGELPGEHTLAVEFHFEPTLSLDGDGERWQGKLRTGDLTVPAPPR